MIKFSAMAPTSVPAGGPATFYGLQYQLLWSLFHATQWKVVLGSDHSITAILEPESGIDFEYRFGQERRVEQIKARSTGKPWSFAELVREVLPSLYRCVDIEVATAYVFVTETSMGKWQEAYTFFKSLGKMPVPRPDEMLSALDSKKEFKVGGNSYTERSLFEHVVHELAGEAAGGEEKVWHLLRGFHFLDNQDFSALVRKIDRALINHGTPLAEVKKKRADLIGDLFSRAAQGNGMLESTGFFNSHGLSEISLKRWVDVQARGSRHMFDCLNTLRYRRDWDVREVSAASSLFLEEPRPEEVIVPGSERPLVSPRSAVLLTGDSGQGKSWQLYRLGHELAKEEQIAVLIQGTGAVDSDLDRVTEVFCREIWGTGSRQSLQDLVDLVRRELPEVQEPWLTVLIDGVRDEEYALSLLQYPWQRLGLRVVLGCRWSDRFAEAGPYTIPMANFTLSELSRYLKSRLGVGWIEFPEDVRRHMSLPLFAQLFCDLQGSGATWKPVNEYQLFERAWSWRTAGAHLAASAVAGLAARLPEEQVYPWPMARVWAAGLRDSEIKGLVDSGLLRTASGGRSLEIWHDRILNWAVAEGLVSALRSGEITVETLMSRTIHGQDDDNPLRRRLDYVAMDTLWLLTTPEFGLGNAVRQFLAALEEQWERRSLLRALPTLGARIAPFLFSSLESPSAEEEQ
jgi:hypothetical protein